MLLSDCKGTGDAKDGAFSTADCCSCLKGVGIGDADGAVFSLKFMVGRDVGLEGTVLGVGDADGVAVLCGFSDSFGVVLRLSKFDTGGMMNGDL